MRAGRLRHRAQIVTLGHSLEHKHHGTIWCEITSKESASPPMPAGLRTGARVEVRARYNPAIRQGAYLCTADRRLLHITSVRDVPGRRAGVIASCDEFVGQAAEYHGELTTNSCRTHLTLDAPYLDEFGQVTAYRHRAEVLLYEVGRPQADDRITIDGHTYLITQYAGSTDDGVVRSLWLDPME